MNSFTERTQFDESAQSILKRSGLLRQEDCVVLTVGSMQVVYELVREEMVYRFFFNSDDYDYLVDNKQVLMQLNRHFGVAGRLAE